MLSSGGKNYSHSVELETEAQGVGPHGQSVVESGWESAAFTVPTRMSGQAFPSIYPARACW